MTFPSPQGPKRPDGRDLWKSAMKTGENDAALGESSEPSKQVIRTQPLWTHMKMRPVRTQTGNRQSVTRGPQGAGTQRMIGMGIGRMVVMVLLAMAVLREV